MPRVFAPSYGGEFSGKISLAFLWSVIRALVSAHYYRPRLKRVLEIEEERLGSDADDSAFHANLLQLLREHKEKMAMPVSRVTEQLFMAILRAVVDLGLVSGAC